MRIVAIAIVAMLLAVQVNAEQCAWPEWEHFAERYIESGRVIDGSDERLVTTSEGQSYALFFALVAGDKQRFKELLNWTSANLLDGDLTKQLPAWLWGRMPGGGDGILDTNSAADSDLWIAYNLAEAGRLWSSQEYRTLSFYLAKLILRRETIVLEKYGTVLLPARVGFVMKEGDVRLNPSYFAPQLLRRMATLYPKSKWLEVENSAHKLLIDSSPNGYSPDWFRLHNAVILTDTKQDYQGSYDAIRVYLWLGMLHKDAPRRDDLLRHFSKMATLTDVLGIPPRSVDIAASTWAGEGPYGFSAAMLPLLRATGMNEAAAKQKARVINAMRDRSGRDNYYNSVLSLFAMGWEQGRFSFGAEGQLEVFKGVCE